MIRRRISGVLIALITPFAGSGAALAQPIPAGAAPPRVEPAPPAPPAEPPPAPEADLAGADEADPSRPPPAGKGVVWGVVADTASKEPLLDAQVSVVGTPVKAIADLDGRYRLELAPGNYGLRVWYELHKAQRVQNVRVTAGQVTRLDVGLEPDGQVEEVIEIETEADRGSVASQMLIRKNAATVGDAVSAQEIAKTPDRNAADAARRVVGATVVDNKYIYVRGLGERYSNSLLNGTPLPSPDPNRQSVPLDLFPTLVLSDVTIVKTFTPDLPGDFAGGSVQINTRQLPDKFLLQGSLSIGLNTQTTFAERLSYPGSSTDWLGIDSGVRALPGEIPDYKVRRLAKKPDGGTITKDELTFYGQKVNSYMSTRRTTSPPNGSGNLVVGDTLKLGKSGGNLGYLAALSYGRKFSRRPDEILRSYDLETTKLDVTTELGVDQVSWGGIGSATWNPSQDHRVTFTAFYTRLSDNEARETVDGQSFRDPDQIRETRLRFISRSLGFVQLSGEHRFPALSRGTLRWDGSFSVASTDEPDSRGTTYSYDPSSGVYLWSPSTLSGAHLFIEQGDKVYGGGLSYAQPLVGGELPTQMKLGGTVNIRRRELDARRFRFTQPASGSDLAAYEEAPDALFSNKNIGTNLQLEEYTFPSDRSTGEQEVFAGYVMTDASLTPWLRVVVGARVEATGQKVEIVNRFASDSNPPPVEKDDVDLLPALSAVIKTSSKSNLRFAFSRTLARPQLRELTEAPYDDFITGRSYVGNSDVERTRITNLDARFELFPATGEVAAISVFYKKFEKPIEQTVDSNNVFSVANAKGAQNPGVELELRKTLGFVSEAVRDFSVVSNFTLVGSSVELDRSEVGQAGLTSESRALQGQSPYVVNVGLDYSRDASGTRARLLYNVAGQRISLVGRNGLPDVYEQPRHQVDVTVAQRFGEHVDVKLSAENLLNSPVRFFQGEDAKGADRIFNQYKTGATVTLGAALTY